MIVHEGIITANSNKEAEEQVYLYEKMGLLTATVYPIEGDLWALHMWFEDQLNFTHPVSMDDLTYDNMTEKFAEHVVRLDE